MEFFFMYVSLLWRKFKLVLESQQISPNLATVCTANKIPITLVPIKSSCDGTHWLFCKQQSRCCDRYTESSYCNCQVVVTQTVFGYTNTKLIKLRTASKIDGFKMHVVEDSQAKTC